MTSRRKNVMLCTAGHVDHGKTALVKILTGCDTDVLAVEKQRGLTIELGFAPCTMADDRIVGIVDVPGHVGFIRNMVAGAHGVDVVILVVAADDGVMPQTREHLDILTLMGARRGVIALTKIDMVDDEICQLAAEGVRQCVKGSFLEDATICPLSNITGEGFGEFQTALNIAVDECTPCPTSGAFRLWVERAFSIKGFGSVVSGVPTSGEVKIEDRLYVGGSSETCRLRHLEVYGADSDVGRAGECIAMNVADIDSQILDRGNVLTQCKCDSVMMFEAELTMLAALPNALKDYAQVHVHVGTVDVMANIAMLEGQNIDPGESRMVQVRLREAVPVACGERFVIRSSMAGLCGGMVTTVAGGRILALSNKRLKRNRPWLLESLRARREAIDSPAKWCELNLREAASPISVDELSGLNQMTPHQTREIVESLLAGGKAMSLSHDRVICHDTITDAAAAAVEALDRFHNENSVRLSMDIDNLRDVLGLDTDVLTLVMEELMAADQVEMHDRGVSLSGHAAKISVEDRTLCERLEELLRNSHLATPLPAELASLLGVSADELERLIAILSDQGVAVRLDEKVILHVDAIASAQELVLRFFERGGGFSTMEFRDALGVSRKYVIPLLDYFDSIRLTTRSANRRRQGALAKKLLAERSQ